MGLPAHQSNGPRHAVEGGDAIHAPLFVVNGGSSDTVPGDKSGGVSPLRACTRVTRVAGSRHGDSRNGPAPTAGKVERRLLPTPTQEPQAAQERRTLVVVAGTSLGRVSPP